MEQGEVFYMLDYEQIGKQIKIARIQTGVTQEYLAEKVKISSTHLSNVERGTTKVGLNVIVDISRALHVSLDLLLCNEIGTPYQKSILNSRMAELLEDFTSKELIVLGELIESTKKVLRRVYAKDNIE